MALWTTGPRTGFVTLRKYLGWSLSRKMDSSLPLQALEMALAQRQVTSGLIHHCDRGRQYCSFAYVKRLQSVGARISMSAPGQATENARAESFIKTVKYEEVDVHRYQTFLEDVYNTKRLHSSLDYVPPDEFESTYLKCSCMDGMDFLGALQPFSCQHSCQPLHFEGWDKG